MLENHYNSIYQVLDLYEIRFKSQSVKPCFAGHSIYAVFCESLRTFVTSKGHNGHKIGRLNL